MAFHPNSSTLYVGTDNCMNIRTADGVIMRYDGSNGLPMNRATAATVTSDGAFLWVGTQAGALRWDLRADTWRFFFGPRYLPGASTVTDVAAITPTLALVVTDQGVAFLQSQTWTLAQKAAWYETILPRHNRHGLVSDCALPAFGDTSRPCFNSDDDNNGLWTSIVVAAETLRFAVTGDPAVLTTAETYLGGLTLLNAITGVRDGGSSGGSGARAGGRLTSRPWQIPGLMARSATAPGEAHGDDGTWHDSNVSGKLVVFMIIIFGSAGGSGVPLNRHLLSPARAQRTWAGSGRATRAATR